MYLELNDSLSHSQFEKIIKLVTSRSNECYLDLRGISFIDPYGLVGLVAAAKYCKLHGKSLKLALPRLSVYSYMETMNFFEHAKENNIIQGLSLNRLIPFKKTERPLLEITKLKMQDLSEFVAFTELLDKRMGMMFNGQLEEITAKRITTNLLEVCQNIEHSRDEGYVAAQKYNESRMVKIGVMDLGIGIAGSLREHYERKGVGFTDKRAISLALQPQVSSRSTGGGLGLYRLSKYVQEHPGSELIIRSGTVRCHLKHNGTRYHEGIPFFPGTQVGLTIKP